MNKKLFVTVLCVVVLALSFAGTSMLRKGTDKIDKGTAYVKLDNGSSYVNTNNTVVTRDIVKEGPKVSGDFMVGPEIEVSGLNGFYDYQTNGECKHMIYRHSANMLHAIMMVSTDSTNVSTTRRTKYSISTNDGTNWTDIGEIPDNLRSGFPSLSAKADGSAIVASHYDFSGVLAGGLNYEIAPGSQTFEDEQVPFNFIWPGTDRLANGNILTVGETYQGAAATDSGAITVFNSTSNTFGPLTRVTTGTDQVNMRWTYAAGPGGKAVYILNTISDVGGNFGTSRIWAVESADNGATWSAPAVIFQPQIWLNDTLSPFFGMDAIYDADGNWYLAFNTTSLVGTFATAKLWVLKEGQTVPHVVATHSDSNAIPEAAELLLHADAGLVTLDHPTLSITSDNQMMLIAFSVQYDSDTLGGFNKAHIWTSYAPLNTLKFTAPTQVTANGPNSFDERYPSLNKVTPVTAQGYTGYLVYQKDPQPGSSAFNDNAPITRAYLMFRTLTPIPIGIKPVSGNVPDGFALRQNYPNPFNPTTKIRFELPQNSFVTLKLYNVVGEEISTLINENVNAGVNEYELNASDLPSGIYFYTLNAGTFTDTKKMILIK